MVRIQTEPKYRFVVKEFKVQERSLTGNRAFRFTFTIPEWVKNSVSFSDCSATNFKLAYFLVAQVDPDDDFSDGLADSK